MNFYDSNEKQNAIGSVFTHLFSKPAYTIQLYRALHPEDSVATEADVVNLTLVDDALNENYNDLGFVVRDHLIVFVVVHGMWSNNVLLHGMMLMAQAIQEYLGASRQNVFGRTKLQLPHPEFYVLYTGDRTEAPREISLAKDFFGGSDGDVKFRASVMFGGRKAGDIISQYATFNRMYQVHCNLYGKTRKAVFETIRICKKANILVDYLTKSEQEVINLLTEEETGQVAEVIDSSSEVFEATLRGDSELVAATLEKIYDREGQFFNFEDESSLSALLTLAYLAANDYYTVTGEENGCYDYLFTPISATDPVILMKLSYGTSSEEDLQRLKDESDSRMLVKHGSILVVCISYHPNEDKHFQCLIERIEK